MNWLTQKSAHNHSFSWGDYRAHKSMGDWTVYKWKPGTKVEQLGKAKTKRQAAEVCTKHFKGE